MAQIGQKIFYKTDNYIAEEPVFTNLKVTQIGIQGHPQTSFYFNGDSEHLIRIGSTGIFELDLSRCNGSIVSLQFKDVIKDGVEDGYPVIIIDYLNDQEG